MAEGLELAIVITGQGTAAPAIQQAEGAVKSLGTASQRAGEQFTLSQRRAQSFATAGLGQIAQVSPQLVNLLGDVASKSTLVMKALQGAGVIGIGIAVATTVWEMQEKRINANVEALKKLQDQERTYLGARAALQSFTIDQQRRVMELEGQTLALQLRASGRVIDAIEEERRTKLKLLEVDEARARAELARLARTPEGALRAERAGRALDARFGRERGLVNADAERQDLAERNQLQAEVDRVRLERERGLADAINARRQAQLTTLVEALQGEGRVAEAIAVGTQQRLEAIRFEAEQRRVAIGERIKDERGAEQARLELVQETSAKIVAVIQQEAQQRHQAIGAGATALQGIGVGQNVLQGLALVDQLARQRREAAQGFAAARAAGVPERDLVHEENRVSQEMAAKVRQYRQEWAAFPAVLDAIKEKLGDLEWGGFINDVAKATTALATLTTPARVAGNALGEIGRQARGTAEVFQDDLPNSIGRTVAYVDALTGRLAVLVQWFGAAERAAERFADAE